MDVLAWNSGPRGIKFGYAKPVRGDWRRIEEWFVAKGEAAKLVYRRKPDNEDMFFYARIHNPSQCADCFAPLSGDVPNSNAAILSNDTKCHMSWNNPQEMHLQVQPTP